MQVFLTYTCSNFLNSTIATADGWRTWMDIGTFTSNGTDHTYVGLKSEGADRADAVINWGDNQAF